MRVPTPDPTAPHAAYLIQAEFHVDQGSVITAQFPFPTGVDEAHLSELMMPEGAHERTEDWTVFILNQTPLNTVVSPLYGPLSPQSEDEHTQFAHSNGDDFPSDSETTDGNSTDDCDSDNSALIKPYIYNTDHTAKRIHKRRKPQHVRASKPALLYVLNLVNTKLDSKVKRGAVCKSLAVASYHPWVQVFKPILILAMQDHFDHPSPTSLGRLYDALNAMPYNPPPLSRDEKMILRVSERRDLFEEKWRSLPPLYGGAVSSMESLASISPEKFSSVKSNSSSNNILPPPLPSPLYDPSGSSVRQGNTLHSNSNNYSTNSLSTTAQVPKDTHFYDTKIEFERSDGKKLNVPIRVPLASFEEEIGDFSLIELIKTFSIPVGSPLTTNGVVPPPPVVLGPVHRDLHSNGAMTHPIILLINALITNKRVMFLGHGKAAHVVSGFVLAACALGSGSGVVLKGFTRRAFPYTCLGDLDHLLSVDGYIAGVTNPRFELNQGWWDVLCNIKTGRITVSSSISPAAEPLPVRQHNLSPLAYQVTSSESSLASLSIHSSALPSPPATAAVTSGRADTPDNTFMDEITSAIAAHYGEPIIRSRFVDYLTRFVRLASRHEEDLFGKTQVGYRSQAFSSKHLGSGVVHVDEDSRQRDMNGNSGRFEAWMRTKSYQQYRKDFRRMIRQKPFYNADISYQLHRLKFGKNLTEQEAEGIFKALATHVQEYSQLVELIAQLPSHSGGFLPLGAGLIHSSTAVRLSAATLFDKFQQYPLGALHLQSLNLFHRMSLTRIRQEQHQPELSPKNIPKDTSLLKTTNGLFGVTDSFEDHYSRSLG